MRYDVTMPLIEGRVTIDGVKVVPSRGTPNGTVLPPDSPLKSGDFDLCDLNIANWLPAIEAGWQLIGLPIFTKRKHLYSYMFCRADAGIHGPKDLEGKRVLSTITSSSVAIWSRALLETHHNVNIDAINWVSPREPSSGELVYDLCEWAGWKITQPIADCLFTAVSTDTGSFQYPSTTPDTLETAAHLVDRGADLGKICKEVYQSYPLTRVKLLRHVYNKFRLTHGDKTAYFWLKLADYSRTGASTEESEGLIDHIRAIEGVVVAVVFEEVGPNHSRISLRSKDERVNVNEVAALFGGGGHKAAAGARVEGSHLSVQRRVLGAVKRALAAQPAAR